MKFTCETVISKSREEVVALWEDPKQLGFWQDGFQSLTHTEGEPGAVGSRSVFVYQSGKRKIVLEETILINQLPEEFKGLYEAREMSNTMHNWFTETEEGSTRWTSEIEYNSFKGFMPRLLAKLMPGMFRKQTQKWMDQFKVFAETEIQ